MDDHRTEVAEGPASSRNAIEEVLREGARRLLQHAIETEVEHFVERFHEGRDESGQRLVVRNGWREERDILTSLGPLAVRQPRVDDKRHRPSIPEVRDGA